MAKIAVEQLNKSFDGKPVLHDLSVAFPIGKVSCIMAPSGGGKTTLLRILMGLERADSGTITGMEGLRKSAVFQEDRLCEHLTPVANIRLVTPSLHSEQVLAAMEKVGLVHCKAQSVRELSGGMRRRVALLRALMADYDILFLDEPFKGLDLATKTMVMRDTLARCAGRTVLLVTHNPVEADAMQAELRFHIPPLTRQLGAM